MGHLSDYPVDKKWWNFKNMRTEIIKYYVMDYILYPDTQACFKASEERNAWTHDLAAEALRRRQLELYPDS